METGAGLRIGTTFMHTFAKTYATTDTYTVGQVVARSVVLASHRVYSANPALKDAALSVDTCIMCTRRHRYNYKCTNDCALGVRTRIVSRCCCTDVTPD